MQLRPYQREAVEAIFRYFETQSGNPIVTLPTGSGKSFLQAAFIRNALIAYPGERVMLVSHVKELLQQNGNELKEHWPDADIGYYSAGMKRRSTDARITIAGIQSCYKRAHEFGSISLIIIDEMHLVPKKGHGMYRRFLADIAEINPKVKVIGMSATPYRLDSGMLHQGDGAIFTDIVYEASVSKLIHDGYLCPLISKNGVAHANLSGVKLRGGEFIPSQLETAVNQDAVTEAAVNEIVELCSNRNKWLVFCAGVAHAQNVCDEIARRGVSVAYVTGETPTKERHQILADFKNEKLRAVCNVNVLSVGYNAPDIDAVILLRPTMSPGLHYQMIGRSLRMHPSKQNALILDFAGNLMRHGPIDNVRVQEKTGMPGEAPSKMCPQCRSVVALGAMDCPDCGFVFPRDENRTPKHDVHASELDVLTKLRIETTEVDSVTYMMHLKPGKPTSLRVDYECGLLRISEWVCLEHGGYAQTKALKWWKKRCGIGPTIVPTKVEDAFNVAHGLLVPRYLTVDMTGKWPRIVGHTNFVPPGDRISQHCVAPGDDVEETS